MDPSEADSFLLKFKTDIYARDDCPNFVKNSRVAEMYAGMGRLVQSLEFFEAAVKDFQTPEYDPTIYRRVYLSTLGLYASTLDETGDFVNAETMFKAVLDEDPENFIIGDYAYFLHRRKRSYDDAEKHFKRALGLFPNHASMHLKYAGFLRHVRKDMERATFHYRLSTEVNPNYADGLGSFASFLHGTGSNGDKKYTENLYQRAVEADKTHVNNFCNFGLFLSEEIGDYDKAEQMYRSAISISATHANTLYNYAVLLDSHLKRKDEAEVLYRRCLETQPRHAFALYNLAVLREELVNNKIHKSAAAKHAISVLDAAENTSEEKTKEKEEHSLSIMSDEKELELLTDVSNLYERAVEADSNDFTALADCGRFLCDKLSNYERGELFLAASLKLYPQGETALLHMGVLEFIHKKNYDKSQLYFDKVLEINPDHISSLHQKARMLVAKYAAKGDAAAKSAAQDVLDEAFKAYESVVLKAAEPGPYATEYLSQVVNHGSLKQKLASIMFVEANKHLQGAGGDVQKLMTVLKKK